MSVGACDHNWRDTDDAGRLDLMKKYYSHIVHRDGLNAEEVASALSEIDEFEGFPFETITELIED